MIRWLTLVLLAWTAVAADLAPSGPEASADSPTRRAAHILIDGMIDDGRAAYFNRSLDAAKAAGVDVVVVELTTDGGYLHSGLAMAEAAIEATRDDHLELIALVEGKAWSAGAMIAYSHKAVYMTPGSHIGDIGIITQGKDGQIEYLPEKIESPVRAHLRSIAEANGWNTAKLVKMTARNQSLYRFDLADGTTEFVIEDDLGTFLADHPDVDADKKILILGPDRLVSYTAQEAVREEMATAVVDNLPALWQHLGIDSARVIDLAPTSNERLGWMLASFAPLLAALAVLFAVIEFKTPGVGLWAILAAICGASFFLCQYYLDLANSLELVFIGLGIIAIAVELFLLPTGGVLGFTGGAAVVTGLVLAFMPDGIQFTPGAVGYSDALSAAFLRSMISLIIMTVGLVWLIRMLPNSRAMARLAARGEITGTSAGAIETNASALLGRRVMTSNPLRPAGNILIDGDVVSATSEHGEFIDGANEVEIVAVHYGQVVVRLVAGEAMPPTAPASTTSPEAGPSGAAT